MNIFHTLTLQNAKLVLVITTLKKIHISHTPKFFLFLPAIPNKHAIAFNIPYSFSLYYINGFQSFKPLGKKDEFDLGVPRYHQALKVIK